MTAYNQWPQEKVDRLIKLYLDEIPLKQIAIEMGISYGSTKAMLTTLRKRGYDIPLRDQKRAQARRRATLKSGQRVITNFDLSYHGAIPCGHWMITKPWPYKPAEEEDVA